MNNKISNNHFFLRIPDHFQNLLFIIVLVVFFVPQNSHGDWRKALKDWDPTASGNKWPFLDPTNADNWKQLDPSNPKSEFRKILHGAGERSKKLLLGVISNASGATYYYNLFKKANTWKPLPESLLPALSKHYPIKLLRSVRYAENVSTPGNNAITLDYDIFFPSKLELDYRGDMNRFYSDLHWMLHELEHVVQYEAHGGSAVFLPKYAIQGLLNISEPNIHDAIQLEIDAENKANRIIDEVWKSVKKNLSGQSEFPKHQPQVIQTGVPVVLRTRRNLYLNTDNIHLAPAKVKSTFSDNKKQSNEVWWIEKIDKSSGTIFSGEPILLRTRRGHYLNTDDVHLAPAKVKNKASYNHKNSNEVWWLEKVDGSFGPITNAEPVLIRTRRGLYLNTDNIHLAPAKVKKTKSSDPRRSNEVWWVVPVE